MKAIALILALLASANINAGAAKATATPPDISDLLARAAIVVNLDYDADVVTLEDVNSLLWDFTGCEDWCVGDVATLLLWDANNTPETILDDVIISATYSGYEAADINPV